MSQSHAHCPGHLRIEEVDADLVLPQILRLRAMVGRRVSLAPDASPWLDPFDARAAHWGVFRGAELVAAARLCVHASVDDLLPDAVLRRPLRDSLSGPVAWISHCVVQPRLRHLRLDSTLDAVRIERARQLRLGAVIAVARTPRRLAALAKQGFAALGSGADEGRALVLHLTAEPVRLQVLSRM